jgi:hypothetical protein
MSFGVMVSFECNFEKRKNPEIVKISGFYAPISFSVLQYGTSGDNGLKQKSSHNEIRYDYSIWCG